MDKIKEKIGYYKILVPMLWTGLFIIGGGITWLINNSFSFKILFFTGGIIFEIILEISLLLLHKRIKKLIKDI